MSRRNRRQFLKQSSAALAGFWVADRALALDSKLANGKLNIACVGVGSKGSSDTDQAARFGKIVALCDIDEGILNGKAGKFPDAKKFFDFREMFAKMGDKIDAVTVSTPDHTHYPAAAMAIKAKKHVYVQKPLTHSVWEARQLRLLAKEHGVCSQMGNQGTAENGLRRAVELVRGGLIGQVREAHVWTNRPVWPQAPQITDRPKGTFEVPKTVHWNEFLGPAPERPYAPGYHPFKWRGFWDFGTGALGDMACHTANMAFMALRLGSPTNIAAENGAINPETFPAWARITFQFPERDALVPVKFVWYEGKKDGKHVLPAADLVKGQGERDKGYSVAFKDDVWQFIDRTNDPEKKNKPRVVSSGSFLVGDKGTLFSPNDYGADVYLVTPDGVERIKGDPEKLPKNGKGDDGMKEEWVRAIVENKPEIALSNFDYAAMLTETILLGNVAMRTGKALEWDGPGLKVTNVLEAAKYIKREPRKGWEV